MYARLARLRLGEERDCSAPALRRRSASILRDPRATSPSARKSSGSQSSTSGSRASSGAPRRPSTRRARCEQRLLQHGALLGRQLDGCRPDTRSVVGEAAHALEGDRLVARLADRRPVTIAPWLARRIPSRCRPGGEPLPCVGVVDPPSYSSTNASSPSKMHEFWCMIRGDAEDREERHVVRVTVHDHGRVGARAVQLGVDEHRGRDVPLALDDRAVGVDAARCRRPNLLPPDAPRVAPDRRRQSPT